MMQQSANLRLIGFIIVISLLKSYQVQCQFGDYYQSFMEFTVYDSLSIAQLTPSRAKGLYYIKDSLKNRPLPLAKMHCKTNSTKGHRLDNQFEAITNLALPLGLNSIRVDSSHIDGVICEYWISLYRLKIDQIKINDTIVADNLLCVFGKFDEDHREGNSFKINGRKIRLKSYEYIKRNIAHGKRGSVELNSNRLELVGGKDGGEAFYAAPGLSTGESALLTIAGSAALAPLGMFMVVNGANTKQIPTNFAYFLYHIYDEKVVIAKTREDLIAAKRKEWREKKAAEEAKKKAKESEKKNR